MHFNRTAIELQNPPKRLTQREEEIVELLCRDCLNNGEIATKLGLSQKTVDTHRAHIMKKLRCGGIAGLAKLYWQKHNQPALESGECLNLHGRALGMK